MDSGEVLEFWNKYRWDWKTPADVQAFVEIAIEQGMYEDSIDTIGLDENWYTNWWLPVHDAIERFSNTHGQEDITAALDYLLSPFKENEVVDFAIYDSLLKSITNFPANWPEHLNTLDLYYTHASEFAWLNRVGRYFCWTFYAPETIALSPGVPPEFLHSLFIKSIWLYDYNAPQQAFRVRLALAMNQNTPKEIIHFLWDERDRDWLICEEDVEDESSITVVEVLDGSIRINENSEVLEEARVRISDMEDMSSSMFYTEQELGGAGYLDTLFDIAFEGVSARECLLAAFAKNPNLSEHQYEEIAKEESDFVRYMLSKNPGVPRTLAVQLALQGCSFTFTPHSGNDNDPITLD
jgi:hypothetical protein